MTPEEKRDAVRTARVLRVGRKISGISQDEVAHKMGVSQSAVSKMESGILIPSASQWNLICKVFGVHPQLAIDEGIVDNCFSIRSSTPYLHSRFKMSKNYTHDMGSSVRTALPFLKFFESVHGPAKLQQYLVGKDVDPDYFYVYDNPINLNFLLDTAIQLVRDGLLDEKSMVKLTAPVAKPQTHGSLRDIYKDVSSQTGLVLKFIQNINRYDTNFEYTLDEIEARKFTLSAKPSAKLSNIGYKNEVLGSFLNLYRKHYLMQFSRMVCNHSARVTVLQNHFQGADRCIYKVEFES